MEHALIWDKKWKDLEKSKSAYFMELANSHDIMESVVIWYGCRKDMGPRQLLAN